jgi:hypothetical protein
MHGHITPKTHWYQTPANLELLGRYLMEECDFTLAEFLPILEKPWNWEFEFEKAQKKYQVNA